jgi:hypothetical protein
MEDGINLSILSVPSILPHSKQYATCSRITTSDPSGGRQNANPGLVRCPIRPTANCRGTYAFSRKHGSVYDFPVPWMRQMKAEHGTFMFASMIEARVSNHLSKRSIERHQSTSVLQLNEQPVEGAETEICQYRRGIVAL